MAFQVDDTRTGERSLWPKRAIDRVLAVSCIVGILCVSLLILTFPFGRDQGIFAVIGEGLLNGQVPYRDLWDVKTPGIFIVFALAEGIFGHHMLGPRILECVALFATSVIFVDLGRAWFRDVRVGYLAALILGIFEFQLDFWHTSQPETYGGMFLVWASWLLSGTASKRAAARHVASGVVLGMVVLMKPHLALPIPLLLWGLLRRGEETPKGPVGSTLFRIFAGGSCVVGGVALWIWAHGAWSIVVWTWRDFAPGYAAVGASWTISTFYMSVYSALVTLLFQLTALIGLGLVLALSLSQLKSPGRRWFWWLVGQGLCLGLAVALQHKSFKYHYAAGFPVLALAAGWGWTELWKVATAPGWRYAPLFLIAFGAAYFMRFPVTDLTGTIHERAWNRIQSLLRVQDLETRREVRHEMYAVRKDFDLANAEKVAKWVQQRVEPDETFLLWGCDSIIYWLSERRPATRFIHNIPQRSPWQEVQTRRQFMDDIKRNRPSVIVVQHGDVFASVTGEHTDSAGAIHSFSEFSSYLRTGFKRERTIGNFDVYVR
jgi:hypothetical protein